MIEPDMVATTVSPREHAEAWQQLTARCPTQQPKEPTQ